MVAKRGTFIALDGGEGGGKDTQIARIRELLKDIPDVVYTREPGGTEIGQALRQILLSSAHERMTVETEIFLFCAARAQLMKEVVIPALKDGKTVISNRFDAGTAAYQIYGRQRMPLWHVFRTINTLAITDHDTGKEFRPDRYILLDVDSRVGLLRKQNIPEEITRFERAPLDFHERVRAGFRTYLLREYRNSHVVVDANRIAEEVWSDVKRYVMEALGTVA